MPTGRPAEANRRYQLETVSRACSLLKAFTDEQETLSLADITKRTGFERTITFRLLRTLEKEGFIHRTEGHRYCRAIQILDRKRFRIGYASQTEDSAFVVAVTQSIRWAASQSQVELVMFDNKYSVNVALRNAERMIREGVQLAIEFQVYERIAPKISNLFEEAGIPLIAIEVPHPGATFFGIDNYRVGMLAGKALAQAAKKYWVGNAEEVLFLELDIAGSLPRLRVLGAEAALAEVLPVKDRVRHLDTRGEFLRAFETVRKHLRRTPARRTLITGINDEAVLGALHAFEEAGRRNLCLAVGLGGLPEARRELRKPGSRLVGSVGFFPERYGEGVLRLALAILNGKEHAPTVHVNPEMLTARNVDRFYPHDLVRTA
jgi:ribose transport system substrate-binding protein